MRGKQVGVRHHCQFCLVLRWKEEQARKRIVERRKAPLEERNLSHGPRKNVYAYAGSSNSGPFTLLGSVERLRGRLQLDTICWK